MEPEKKEKQSPCFSDYPKFVILGRLILLGLVFSSGIYVFYQLKSELSFIYIFYSLVAIGLILPLSRCVFCFYHGRFCNLGWGKVAGFLFPKRPEDNFTSGYAYMLFIYPIWVFPLLGTVFQVLRFRNFFWLVFSAGYVLLLFLEKVYLKKAGCRFCSQKKVCPGVPFNSKFGG